MAWPSGHGEIRGWDVRRGGGIEDEEDVWEGLGYVVVYRLLLKQSVD